MDMVPVALADAQVVRFAHTSDAQHVRLKRSLSSTSGFVSVSKFAFLYF